MLRVTYNPFPVEIDNLTSEHLAILKDVAEGWYVEYKREIVSARSIAKSISAFANHYGGWLFYGVEEAGDGSNTAGSFPGLDTTNLNLLIERIRNAVKDSIQPSPYYEYKVLSGPCSLINLAKDRSIVTVQIPTGTNAPYVHRDGRIYRRVADSSDPKPETDRFILDQLWQRGQKARQQLDLLLSSELELSSREANVCYIDLFFLTDPLGTTQKKSQLTFDQFIELMSDTKVPDTNIVFDNFFMMSNGYVARQINANHPFNLVLTWRHYYDGSSRISLPISSQLIASLNKGDFFLQQYEQETVIINLLRDYKHQLGYLLDLNMVMLTVMSFIKQQWQLMAQGGLNSLKLYVKTVINNTLKKVPFIDTETYIQFVKDYGFPVIQSSRAFAPPDTAFESLVTVPELDNLHDDIMNKDTINVVRAFIPIFVPILNAFGLPNKVFWDSDESVIELWEASKRANRRAIELMKQLGEKI